MSGAKTKAQAKAKVPAHFYPAIGKIRQWIDGFEAAGKAGPVDKDVLRQIQIWIKDNGDAA